MAKKCFCDVSSNHESTATRVWGSTPLSLMLPPPCSRQEVRPPKGACHTTSRMHALSSQLRFCILLQSVPAITVFGEHVKIPRCESRRTEGTLPVSPCAEPNTREPGLLWNLVPQHTDSDSDAPCACSCVFSCAKLDFAQQAGWWATREARGLVLHGRQGL